MIARQFFTHLPEYFQDAGLACVHDGSPSLRAWCRMLLRSESLGSSHARLLRCGVPAYLRTDADLQADKRG
jgi:hypothetical protein